MFSGVIFVNKYLCISQGRAKVGQKKYYEALGLFNLALEKAKGIDDSSCGEALRFISFVYTSVGDYDLSNEVLHQAISFFDKAGNTKYSLICYNNVGNNYLQKKFYTKALREFDLALQASSDVNYDRLVGMLKLNRALCLYELGRSEEAYIDFQTSLTLFDPKISRDLAARSRLYMAKIEFANTKNEDLFSEYNHSLGVGAEFQDLDLQLKSADALAEGLAELGQYTDAYKNAMFAKQLKDSLTDNQLLLKIRSLDDRNNFEMDKRRIEASKVQEISETKIAYQSKVICLLIGLIILSLLSAFLISKAYRAISKS